LHSPTARERRRHEREAARAAVSGPRERCADRMVLTRWVCMVRECENDPRLRHHPECLRMEQAEQDQRQRMQER
jgi:hypothetical protein